MANLKWFLRIGGQFFKLMPGQTILAIFLSLFSKALGILSSYLPLKVVILLGSAGIPKFFPSSFQDIDRELLVVGLSIATVIFYILFITTEKSLVILGKRAATVVLKNSSKMPLFENQNEVAQKGVQRYSESLAELFFLLVGLPILGWFSPEILILITIYALIATLVVQRFSAIDEGYESDPDEDNLKPKILLLSDIGFLIAFVFLIHQALNSENLNLLFLIITFLFLRRLQTSAKKLIFNLRALIKQNIQINALFFHEAQLTVKTKTKASENSFWLLAYPDNVPIWARSVLEQLTHQEPKKITSRWFQMNVRDVLTYRISVEDGAQQEYLIKIFNKKQKLAAQHESEMLMQVPGLPSLELLAIETVKGFHCLVYEWGDGTKVCDKGRDVLFELNKAMIRTRVPQEFETKYLRSHVALPQRLDKEFWERVANISNTMDKKSRQMIEKIFSISDDICERLSHLPTRVINPKLSNEMLVQSEHDGIQALNWGDSAIEPMGAGWPISKESINFLSESCQLFCDEEDRNINKFDVQLSTLTYAFEQRVAGQRFEQAFELVPSIIECFEYRSPVVHLLNLS